MAALTPTTRAEWVAGNKRVVAAKITVTTDGDTWDSKLGIIDGISVSCDTAATAVGAGASGGTVAFHCANGTVVNVIVHGA